MVSMKQEKCPTCGGTFFRLAGKASKLCYDECLQCRRTNKEAYLAAQSHQPKVKA